MNRQREYPEERHVLDYLQLGDQRDKRCEKVTEYTYRQLPSHDLRCVTGLMLCDLFSHRRLSVAFPVGVKL